MSVQPGSQLLIFASNQLIYSITGSLWENQNLSPVMSVRFQWLGIDATILKIKDKTLELIHYIRRGTRKRLQSPLVTQKKYPKGHSEAQPTSNTKLL